MRDTCAASRALSLQGLFGLDRDVRLANASMSSMSSDTSLSVQPVPSIQGWIQATLEWADDSVWLGRYNKLTIFSVENYGKLKNVQKSDAFFLNSRREIKPHPVISTNCDTKHLHTHIYYASVVTKEKEISVEWDGTPSSRWAMLITHVLLWANPGTCDAQYVCSPSLPMSDSTIISLNTVEHCICPICEQHHLRYEHLCIRVEHMGTLIPVSVSQRDANIGLTRIPLRKPSFVIYWSRYAPPVFCLARVSLYPWPFSSSDSRTSLS